MADALPLDRILLPLLRTRFIGRDGERASARSMLLGEAAPLLTLTGPGGVGKTRLALAIAGDVADHFADGIAWTDLAPVDDATLVPMTVATALAITPSPGRSVTEDLARHLRAQQTLLLLDNCEHVLAAVADLAANLLMTCPALQVLVTSRAPLHVRGEQVLPVKPLPLPLGDTPSLATIQQNEAVRLFVERARAVRPTFHLTESNATTVAAICRALDGLPLAIELAAARITILSPDALLAHMTDRLSLLSDGPRDAPTRQQAIEATIAWSYELLRPEDQAMFRRLATFSGGFTLEAAQLVAGDGHGSPRDFVRGLSALVDHSLIHRMDRQGEPRFTMLETIRAFGLERLTASGEESRIRDRHAAYFLQIVRSLETWVAPYLPDARQILDRLETEYPNIRAALAWQRETGDVSGLLEMAGDLIFFWQLRGHLADGRAWLQWGLAQDVEVAPHARASGQLALSRILRVRHDPLPAMELCQASLRHFLSVADSPRTALAYVHAAAVSLDVCDPDLTNQLIDEALATLAMLDHVAWARPMASFALVYRGILAKNQGDVFEAEQRLREVVEQQRTLLRESGREHPFACWPLMAWGAVAHVEGVLPVALERYLASLDHAWRFHETRCSAFGVGRVAGILAASGRWQEAAWLFGAAEAFCERIGIDFTNDSWMLTRAFGLPQPWQGPEDFTGQAAGVRAAVLQRSPAPLPPLADPAAASELWTAGRRVPIDEAIAAALAVDLATSAASRTTTMMASLQSGAAPVMALTPREQEVLAMLCQRLTNAEIASRLFLSHRTVEDHVSRLLDKLNVANRRDAAATAARLGLVSQDTPAPTM